MKIFAPLLPALAMWGIGATTTKAQTPPTFTSLYRFTGGSDGGPPNSPLALGRDGNLYGTTYQLTPAGVLTTVYRFAGTGSAPGALVEASDGTLYGTTRTGGGNSQGSIYKLSIPLPPTFFTGEVALSSGAYYLAFPVNGNVFGYYSFLPIHGTSTIRTWATSTSSTRQTGKVACTCTTLPASRSSTPARRSPSRTCTTLA